MGWEEIIKMKTYGDWPRVIHLPDSFFEEKARKTLRKWIYDIGYESSYKYVGQHGPDGQWAGDRVLEDERVVKLMDELYPLLENLIRTTIEVKHEGSDWAKEEMDKYAKNKDGLR